MRTMDVFVVSRSRWQKSDTLERLGRSAAEVRLVVPESQYANYKPLARKYGCRLTLCPHDGISLTRRFCGESATSQKFLMLDDDLKFYKRVSSTDWHLRYPEDIGTEAGEMLRLVEGKLDEYTHVAVSAREGNHNLPWEGVECSRPLRALAYRTKEFLQVEHGRVKVMEDFDVTLQLLRSGHKNHVIACWAQAQIQTQMAGGCSDYRTLELHEEEARRFADLHPGLVRLRRKKNRSGGEFGNRLEVTIYWQRAWESSKSCEPVR